MNKKILCLIRKGESLLLSLIIATSTLTISSPTALAVQNDTSDKNREVSARFTAESFVLLKNNKKVLPIINTDKVAVFGSTQVNTHMTVFGSGSTNGIGVGFIDTLSSLKKKIQVDSQLEGLYRSFAQTNPPNTNFTYINGEILSSRSIPEMSLAESDVISAASRNNKAVIFIGRTNGEGYDWQLNDEYRLRQQEKNLIDLVTKHFNKVTVVLNTASAIDMTWDSDKIDSILWMGICGEQGANAFTKVISGEINPSGKLTQTWAKQYTDTPTHMNYEMTNTPTGLNGPEVRYEEDIYTGYKYYDTFNITPRFEFGFGMSYTNFLTKVCSVTVNKQKVVVKAEVENSGNFSGKEIVQVYFSAPNGSLEKPYQQLAGFAKTNLLKPHEKQMLTITYNIRDMASYDETNARYILDSGDYKVRVGNSSRNTHVGAVLSLDNLAVTETLSNQMSQAIPMTRFTNVKVKPFSYTGEASEIANAPHIFLSSADIKTVDNKNTITDEPNELAGTTVETAFVNSEKTEINLQSNNETNLSPISIKAASSIRNIPSQIYCADLGVDFAGFVVNNPSGDIDGYKSVTVQKANTQIPFDINAKYDGTYSITLRYMSSISSNSVILKDQNNRKICSFNLGVTNQWADVTATGINLAGVTQLKIDTQSDNITLNWIKFKSETYAGVVTSSLSSGTYGEAINVSLYNRDNPDATIRYTLDNTTPNSSSPIYSSPIRITKTTNIKAIATKNGLNNSSVANFAYTINATSVTIKATKPAINFAGKDNDGNQLISFSALNGMSVFYTLNGTIPTSSSNFYTGPISVALGSTVKAVAIGAGYLSSDVTSIKIANVENPTASFENLGTHIVGTKISLSAKSGNSIYYTISTNGVQPSNPTVLSNKYTTPIVLNQTGTTIIKTVASNSSGMSEILTFKYKVVDKLLTLEDVYQGTATVEQVVSQMTLGELVEVITSSGKSTRFKSPNVRYADGPLGVKTDNYTKWASPSLLASSWDISLFEEQGNAIGMEMVEDGVDFWLAPGVNIMRDPRSGRNPEYFSEDPLLSGVFSSSIVQKVQKHGVGCVVKHFVANDQESHRKLFSGVVVSERALREIYLKPFEISVKTSQPWGLMTTYCDTNRMSTATNFELCTAIARGEWGFEGLIMTDWSCYSDNGMMMYAGNDLIMPSGNADVIKKAVLNPNMVNTNDPNYTKPTTKAMLQRNVVNAFKVMIQTKAFSNIIGKPQTYQYQKPEDYWFSSFADKVSISIESNAGENGVISPATQDVAKGTLAIFTISPDSGYIVDNISVTPKSEFTLEGNSLTIKNAQENTKVAVTFKTIPTAKDVAGLNTLISQAQTKLDSAVLGGMIGNYLHSSATLLTNSINDASEVATNTSSTILQIESAILMIKQAINNFESQRVTVITHEITADYVKRIKAVDYMSASQVIGSEDCNDVDGGKNTTGTYIDTYLDYKIDVEKTGAYSLIGRISTNEANTGFKVFIDGVETGSVIQQTATGGWQNWQTSKTLRLELTQGIHILKIVPIKSGININWISLESRYKKVTSTAEINGSLTPAIQDVEQETDSKIQINPNLGYMVKDVVITPDSDYTLRNNLLTIHKITANTLVNVNFRQLPSTPEFEELGILIQSAKSKLDSAVIGGQIGNYLPNSVKKFATKITNANDVLKNTLATAIQVDDEIRALKRSITEFKDSVIVDNLFVVDFDKETKIKAVNYMSASSTIGSEPCADTDGGQNPTLTATNTWMSYDLAVLKDDVYNFSSRVAVNTANASFNIYIDDEFAGSVVQDTATGGWQKWKTNASIQIPISEGKHTLKILVTNGGLNFNWFKLTSKDYIPSDVRNVISMIEALPEAQSLKFEDVINVNAAKKAFDKLEDNSKISNTLKTKLNILAAKANEIMLNYSKLGDTNLDTKIDIKDLVITRKHILGKTVLKEQSFINGDVNKDKTIDIKDIILIRKTILSN